MFEVYLERAAERDLKRLPVDIYQKIILQIKMLAMDPKPRGCRKIKRSRNDWRIRVGTYRIVYEIDEEKSEVKIMRVRYRAEAYR